MPRSSSAWITSRKTGEGQGRIVSIKLVSPFFVDIGVEFLHLILSYRIPGNPSLVTCREAWKWHSGSATGVAKKPQTFFSLIFASDFMNKHSFIHSMSCKPAHICSGTCRWTIPTLLPRFHLTQAKFSPLPSSPIIKLWLFLQLAPFSPAPCDCAGQSNPVLAPTCTSWGEDRASLPGPAQRVWF